MATAPRKVCVLGAGGVGKTRLTLALGGADRAAYARPGTRVLDAVLAADGGTPVPVRFWDGPGHVLLDSLNQSLLERARAWVLVADGTDAASVAALPWLHAGAAAHVGARPSLVLLNKRDLALAPSHWNPGDLAAVRALGPVLEVSAASGEGVEAARRALAALLGG